MNEYSMYKLHTCIRYISSISCQEEIPGQDLKWRSLLQIAQTYFQRYLENTKWKFWKLLYVLLYIFVFIALTLSQMVIFLF